MIPKTNNDALRKALDEINLNQEKKYAKKEKDTRLYNSYMTEAMNKNGTYTSTIRFLGPGENNDMFFARLMKHAWTDGKAPGKGGKFLQVDCTHFLSDGKIPCGVCDHNRPLWATYTPEINKMMKRKMDFIGNVYIVKDAQNPELEGKVLLYRYPNKIQKRILDKFNPQDPDDAPSDIFDYETGRNFKLKITMDGSFRNYDTSDWADPSSLCGGDEAKINAVHKSIYNLNDYLKEIANSISYDDVKKRIEYFYKPAQNKNPEDADADNDSSNNDSMDLDDSKKVETISTTKTSNPVQKEDKVVKEAIASSDEGDDFFDNL